MAGKFKRSAKERGALAQRKGRTTPWAPPMLKDMRLVYRQDEEKDDTPGQRRCRELLKSNPEKFFEQMMRLETHHGNRLKHNVERRRELNAEPAPSSPGQQASLSPPDEGGERCLLLVEQMLAKYKDGPPSPG